MLTSDLKLSLLSSVTTLPFHTHPAWVDGKQAEGINQLVLTQDEHRHFTTSAFEDRSYLQMCLNPFSYIGEDGMHDTYILGLGGVITTSEFMVDVYSLEDIAQSYMVGYKVIDSLPYFEDGVAYINPAHEMDSLLAISCGFHYDFNIRLDWTKKESCIRSLRQLSWAWLMADKAGFPIRISETDNSFITSKVKQHLTWLEVSDIFSQSTLTTQQVELCHHTEQEP